MLSLMLVQHGYESPCLAIPVSFRVTLILLLGLMLDLGRTPNFLRELEKAPPANG
ncbi:unnamed protein product, partial [marine sediment metagenome]